MRTLLVDNYDSFTYNLFHYLTEVNGQEPVVVRNDDPKWRVEYTRQFDNVVLSPGPGSPENDGDFGICRDIITHGGIPLLGVCLGHQGLAYAFGAKVARAPEPWHGRTSPVEHTGTGLFEGLPSPFTVVRYHSLAVSDLPEELEATAWTPDGLLMGLRHRTRPLWGVQFHPESIGTQGGHQLLNNFRRLTSLRRESVVLQPSSPLPDFRSARTGSSPTGTPRKFRVLAERLPTTAPAETVFERFFLASDTAFWLDSSLSEQNLGRFSIMGDASGPLARVVSADAWERTITVRTGATSTKTETAFLDWLATDLAAVTVDAPPLPFDFALGWVGYLGYELKSECGGERAHRSPDPDAALIFADRAIVFDHATSTTWLLALAEAGDDREALDWLSRTTDALRGLSATEERQTHPLPGRSGVTLHQDRNRYLNSIAFCQDAIAAGETYEVCLTNRIESRAQLDPWHGYKYLRHSFPAPFGALLRFGDLSVLSTSPERFLRVDRTGTIESKPIKGTRPRGADAAQDAALREELRTNEKDRAENLMIVDLVRNDLGRCAEVGSVRVPKLFDVETYATVHQLVSTVTARLRSDCSAVDCVRAAFPGGSMTGAPKIRTMRIIDEVEGRHRGVYSGAIGYLSLTGAADLSIAIRTIVATSAGVTYGTGGAVIALSDPHAEFEETAVKSAPLLAVLQAEFPGRTAGPTP